MLYHPNKSHRCNSHQTTSIYDSTPQTRHSSVVNEQSGGMAAYHPRGQLAGFSCVVIDDHHHDHGRAQSQTAPTTGWLDRRREAPTTVGNWYPVGLARKTSFPENRCEKLWNCGTVKQRMMMDHDMQKWARLSLKIIIINTILLINNLKHIWDSNLFKYRNHEWKVILCDLNSFY